MQVDLLRGIFVSQEVCITCNLGRNIMLRVFAPDVQLMPIKSLVTLICYFLPNEQPCQMSCFYFFVVAAWLAEFMKMNL